jgi:ubiquinone/menaquinone biosynthesis C-methylase UbiE
MAGTGRDSTFGDEVAQYYERYLVPLLFEPYATIMAERAASARGTRLLEVACGTGVVTRALAERLPAATAITATDLNAAMLDQAKRAGAARAITWRQADALALPFPDAAFDVVVCQFGTMFFPDKPMAFAETRRVLAPGGVFLFSVWDRIEENEFADAVTAAMQTAFPDDPPLFMRRTPHGYHDRLTIERDLGRGGFAGPIAFETIAARSRAESPRQAAVAFCEGTPLRNEIEARGARLDQATDAAARTMATRFGSGSIEGTLQALLATVRRGA